MRLVNDIFVVFFVNPFSRWWNCGIDSVWWYETIRLRGAIGLWWEMNEFIDTSANSIERDPMHLMKWLIFHIHLMFSPKTALLWHIFQYSSLNDFFFSIFEFEWNFFIDVRCWNGIFSNIPTGWWRISRFSVDLGSFCITNSFIMYSFRPHFT